jgi:hypothetical protein
MSGIAGTTPFIAKLHRMEDKKDPEPYDKDFVQHAAERFPHDYEFPYSLGAYLCVDEKNPSEGLYWLGEARNRLLNYMETHPEEDRHKTLSQIDTYIAEAHHASV